MAVEERIEIEEFQDDVSYLLYITYIIVAVLIVLLLTSKVYATWINPNDFYNSSAIIFAGIHIIDLKTDVDFAVHLTWTPEFQTGSDSFQLLIMVILSVIFIIIPILITLYQLHRALQIWRRNDELNAWISENITLLYIISCICGSSFTGIELCRSNMFNRIQFDIPLSRTQLLQFKTGRVLSVVLFENLPQFSLQIWYLIKFGGIVNEITYFAMSFSIISIMIAILVKITQGNIVKTRDYVLITMNVKGQEITSSNKSMECRNKINNIKTKIAAILEINENLLEIKRPILISNGLKISCFVYISKIKMIDMNCEKLMNKANGNGELSEMFKNAWNLKIKPSVEDIKCEQYDSMERQKNTVMIRANMQKSIEMEGGINTNNNKEGISSSHNVTTKGDDSSDSLDDVDNNNIINQTKGHKNDDDLVVIELNNSTHGM